MALFSFRTMAKRFVILIGTAAVLTAAGAAVMFGSQALAERAADTPAPDAAGLTPVSIRQITFEAEYTTLRQFLGQIEPQTEAVLSFELGGTLAELMVSEGDQVAAGDIVARLDTSLLEAERQRLVASQNATAAQLTFAEARLGRAQELHAEGFASQETLDQAQATHDELTSRIRETDAAFLSLQINLEKSVLRAPFAGRVGAQDVDVTEILTAGQPVLALIETTASRARVGLPLHLTETDIQNATLVVEGVAYPATLEQLRPDIDPMTRTRTALFALSGNTQFAFGQTATLVIETTVPAVGAWIGMDALQQGSGSIWTILVVEDGIVRNAAVEVLYLQGDRAFVQGSFREGTLMIDAGAHRVVTGQRVHVLTADG